MGKPRGNEKAKGSEYSLIFFFYSSRSYVRGTTGRLYLFLVDFESSFIFPFLNLPNTRNKSWLVVLHVLSSTVHEVRRSNTRLLTVDDWNIVVLQTSFVRTLATGQNKGPMDYVKQGVDQLGQTAGKVKEAVSSATSTVVDAVTGDSNASEFIGFHAR